MDQSPPNALHVTSRVTASLLGGYAFVWGFSSLVTSSGVALGMAFHDAEGLASLCAFLVFLICFLWAFAAPRVGRVWAVLAGGGAIMTGAAWLIARALV
jgi:hypothetical protein